MPELTNPHLYRITHLTADGDEVRKYFRFKGSAANHLRYLRSDHYAQQYGRPQWAQAVSAPLTWADCAEELAAYRPVSHHRR